jgi:hypothetical protein
MRMQSRIFFTIDAAVPVIAGYITIRRFGRLSLRKGEGEGEGLLKAIVLGGGNPSP